MFSSAIAVGLFLSQTAATAPAPEPAKATAAEDPQDRIVCRQDSHISSMVPKKKCRTVREWNALSSATRNRQNGKSDGGKSGGR